MKKEKNQDPKTFHLASRKAGFKAVSWGSVLLAVTVLFMINYLSCRHYIRWDISSSKFYSLSEKSERLLASISNKINVIVFFKPGHRIYSDLEVLLKEYEYQNPQINVEWVDPDRELAVADKLAKKYNIKDENVIIVDNDGRSTFITEDDLTEYDMSPLKQKKLPVLKAFKGELAISSAIMSVTQSKKPTVYFLQGHGEGDPENFDNRAGYSKIAKIIERDNVTLHRLTLGRQKGIPKDCDALVIAGARRSLSLDELDLIREYVEKSGRMLLLTDSYSDSGLGNLMEDWGLQLHRDIVVDPQRTLTGRGDLYLAEYFPHAITKPLKNVTAVMYLPTSLIPVPVDKNTEESADRPHIKILAASSAAGWAETDLENMKASFSANEDIPGPIPVAVAIEKGQLADVDIKPTRMVVFGDADFISNKGIIDGNADLFMSALNWLLDRNDMMAIAPKSVEITKLIISERNLGIITALVILGIPACIALIGGLVWFRRRK